MDSQIAAVDLFAGPGGWDLAARELGIEPLGIELDAAACATRDAAGLVTVPGDVATLDPSVFPCELLIASPPCQAFSMAGRGAGRRTLTVYAEAIERCVEGKPPSRKELDAACEDDRAHLVLEPLRWALAAGPRWIVCEQVEPVLPLWEEMARALRVVGYGTWTGILSAEVYGVPQTRRRAILMCERGGQPRRPAATHARYVGRRAVASQEEALFACEPERGVLAEDRGLLPWVSMADALGWPAGEAVGFPRRNDLATASAYRERDVRDTREPAFALTEKARSWIRFRANAQANAAVRAADEPAPTITGGHDHGDRVWERDGVVARVTLDEAAVLQGFPSGYPWAGSRTKRFEQVGNAVPPPLARAVLSALLGNDGG